MLYLIHGGDIMSILRKNFQVYLFTSIIIIMSILSTKVLAFNNNLLTLLVET